MTFGERLKIKRIENGFSQKDFATKIGLSKDLYNKYENDKNRPNFETITLICESLNISADYLFGLTNEFELCEKVPLSNDEAASVLQQKLSEMNIDIINGNELDVVVDFIDSNQSMLRMLMNKDDDKKTKDKVVPVQLVAKGGDGVQTITVSDSDRAKSLEALEKLKDDK